MNRHGGGGRRAGIEIKTPEQVTMMRQAGLVVARTLRVIAAAVRPGITTAELDVLAEREIRAVGATSSFKGSHGYPATICTVVTADSSWAAHFEHTVVITADGPWVLTAEDGGRSGFDMRAGDGVSHGGDPPVIPRSWETILPSPLGSQARGGAPWPGPGPGGAPWPGPGPGGGSLAGPRLPDPP